MTRAQREELRRRFERLIEQLFGKTAELEFNLRQDVHGNQELLVQWGAGSWTGRLSCTRKGQRELTPREVGGLLSVLQTLDVDDV